MTKTAHYPWPWPSRSSIVITILLVGSTIFFAPGCFRIQVTPKGTLPTMCTGHYPPSIGKDLVVGESSDDLLRKVGKPNEPVRQAGYVYYNYFVQPHRSLAFSP